MKKLLLSLGLFATLSASAQVTIFEDNFDSYTDFAITGVGGWTMVDVDLRPTYGFSGASFTNEGVAMAFIVFNSTATNPPLTPGAEGDWTANSGAKAMACFAAVPQAPINGNDDWVITPQIQLGASGNMLSFWAKSCDATYPDEKFNVWVSTTDTNPASFTQVMATETTMAGPFVEYTLDLDAYQGQNIYIGIHCISEDQFGFMFDDFKVTRDALSTSDFVSSKLAVYPNPANNVVSISNQSNVQINKVSVTDVNGRVVKTMNFDSVADARVNVSDLNTGVYFLNIDTNEGTATKKIVKN
ncbi:T9SS type A sorting domain-containing protein [Flavobacterium sp. SM15]|uniref:T9SS-dependent choice-of-anchor J family protein n=1 Tax=Flavobacterium sp. SM15 TaxID=2908005 RepID=UPI001EDBFDFA|nr:choice-of-anchor J domain-containing protein [Flavobacterium sp. SM15]MCG2611581.1 T9SS type A sorting domain-containing protein [Flavobacterium sp. SM15]